MTGRKVKSIRCTSCGAPLVLYGGGHKIRSLNCEFCGAVLDARDDYAVLAKYSEQEAPLHSPLKTGMEGYIKGVSFTVVGLVVWEAYGERWIDYQLYSPTHGYVWLNYDHGHWTFVRRTRDLPDRQMWRLSARESFTVRDKQFRFYEKYRAHVVYVAGELTWIAGVGDETYLADALAPPLLYSAERSDNESEYYLSEYLEPETVHQAFGITDTTKRRTVHPAQPQQSKFLQPLSKAAWPFALLALLAIIVISLFMDGREVHHEHIDAQALQQGKVTYAFDITRPGRLVELEMQTSLSDAWAFFDISVQQNGEAIFSFGKEVSFYDGHDSEGYWSEGSRTATAHFLVPTAGSYSLEIEASEGGTGNFGGAKPSTPITVKVREGYVSPYYFVILLIISGVLSVVGWISRWAFEARRWKPVLEEGD